MRTICSARSSTRLRELVPAVLLALFVASFGAAPRAQALSTISFDDLGSVAGQVVTGVPGVAIVADNFARSFDIAALIDTAGWGQPASTTPKDPSPWVGGNLVGAELGLALILQNNTEGCDDGVCDRPDDEGAQPAGTLRLLFSTPVSSVGFDLIGVSLDKGEYGWVTLTDVNGASATVQFATLLAALVSGNDTANRIAPLLASAYGLGPIDEVLFKLNGSGALDNVSYAARPEPATALCLGLGLALLGSRRRRTSAAPRG